MQNERLDDVLDQIDPDNQTVIDKRYLRGSPNTPVPQNGQRLDDVLDQMETDSTTSPTAQRTTQNYSQIPFNVNWGRLASNLPGSTLQIWRDTAGAVLTKEGRGALGQIGKEVGLLALFAKNSDITKSFSVGMASGQIKAIPQIFKFYADNYNLVTPEGRRRFNEYIENHPAEFLADAISILSAGTGALAKAGRLPSFVSKLKASNRLLPKFVRGAAKGVEIAVEPGAALDLVPLGRGEKGYNPEIDITTGRDRQTRQNRTTKTPIAEIADRLLGEGQGTSGGDVPAMVLSDSGKANIVETSQFSQPGEVGIRTQDRFTKTRAGLEEAENRIASRYAAGVNAEGYSPFSAVEAGDMVIENFRDTQLGRKGDTKLLFDEIENTRTPPSDPSDTLLAGNTPSVMDTPVPELTAQSVTRRIDGSVDLNIVNEGFSGYFDETQKAMHNLKKSDSKLLSNADYDKSISILENVIEEASEGGFTVRDFNQMRTNFRQQMDLAVANGEVTRTGSGTVASKMYSALTKDMYTMMEHLQSQGLIPSDLTDKIKKSKAEYLRIIKLEETPAGKFLIRNQHNPRFVVDNILRGDTFASAKNINDLKALIGANGWLDLQPALISRMFDLAKRNDNWSPTGLKNTIAKINAADKNKLKTLFGVDLTKELNELAEFSTRLGREPTAHSKRQANFLERIVGDRTAGSVFLRIGETVGTSYAFLTGDAITAGYVVAASSAFNYVGSHWVDSWRNSPNGRRALLEGGLVIGGHSLTAEQVNLALKLAGYEVKGFARSERVRRNIPKPIPQTAVLSPMERLRGQFGQPNREQ